MSNYTGNLSTFFSKLAGETCLAFGNHAVTAGEAAAHTLTIPTDNPVAHGWLVQVYRAGVNVAADAVITLANNALTVANGSTFALAAGDVVDWLVW